MPNWCMNYVTFRHDDPKVIEQIATVAKEATRECGFFSTFAPMPDGNRSALSCMDEWGTKWDIDHDDIYVCDAGPNSIRLSFDTAWSPPNDFYDKLAKKTGVKFEATYCEPGNGFIGYYRSGLVGQTWGLLDADVPEFLKDEYEGIYESISEEEEDN